MKLLKRPVLICVAWIVAVSAGAISAFHINILEEPITEINAMRITTANSATPEINEKAVAAPMENNLTSISGINMATSRINSFSVVTHLEFARSANMFESQIKVRDSIMAARNDMPPECRYPKVVSGSQDESNNVFEIYFESEDPKITNKEIYQLINDSFKNEMESIQGVSSVIVTGADQESIIVTVIPERLFSHQVDFTHLADVISKINMKGASTTLKVGNKEMNLSIDYKATKDKMEVITVKNREGKSIMLKDLVVVEKKVRSDSTSVSKVNGKSVIMVRFYKRPSSNVISVCKNINDYVQNLKYGLNKMGINLHIERDSSVFIKKGIYGVFKAIVEAFILIILVIAVFFRSFKMTVISLLSIPISIAPAFLLMYALGCSLNMFSLFSILLAVGIVGDDCMVFLENLQTNIERGMSEVKATMVTIKDVIGPIIGMTMVSVAAYVPIFFINNPEIEKFKDFGVAMSSSVVISGFFSLTLSPVLFLWFKSKEVASYFVASKNQINDDDHEDHYAPHESTGYFAMFENAYAKALNFVLEHSYLCITLFIPISGWSIYTLAQVVGSEEKVDIDRNKVVVHAMNSMVYNKDYIEACMNSLIDHVMSSSIKDDILGYSMACDKKDSINHIVFNLKDLASRKHTKQEINEKIGKIEKELTHDISFMCDSQESGNAFKCTLQVYGSVAQVEDAIDDVNKNVGPKQIPFYYDSINKREGMKMEVDVEACNRLGVDPTQIITSLKHFRKEVYITTSDENKDSYKVHLELPADKLEEAISAINSIPAATFKDHKPGITNIGSVAKCFKQTEQSNIVHINGTKGVVITFMMPESYSHASFQKVIEEINSEIDKNAVIRPHPSEIEKIKFSMIMKVMVLMAVVFIFLIMAAIFESFVDPFIVLFSIPGSIVGALLMMWYMKCKLNYISMISMITLLSLIAKHGILIVEFANKSLHRTATVHEAILLASKGRLRPIIMTTFCMITGSLALLQRKTEFFEYKIQVGASIVGGMAIGTLISLFIVPSFYLVMKGAMRGEAKSID